MTHFIKAQLAGDLMDEKRSREKMIPAWAITGWNMWQMNDSPRTNPPMNGTIRSTPLPKLLLGLTVGCARCHDHKYDPIPQKDYYRMAGMFASASYHRLSPGPKGNFGRLR